MRITPQTILSALALFLALGGSAYAAATVTGGDVKNNSLTGRDLRDGSVRAADLGAGAKLRGPAGPQGPAGPRGPAGLPAEAVELTLSEGPVGVGGSAAVIDGLQLGGGSWVVDTTGVLSHSETTPQSARCRVLGITGEFEEELGEVGTVPLPVGGGFGTRVPFAVTGAITLDGPGEVVLECSTSRNATIKVQDLGMTAVRVAALEDQSR